MKKSCIATVWLLLGLTGGSSAEDLLSVYHQALQADPRLRIAELRVDIGKAQVRQSVGRLFPQISGTANITWNRQDQEQVRTDSFKGERYNIVLTQPILDIAKYKDWQRASAISGQHEQEFIDTRHQLMLDTVDRYFSVLAAEDDLFFTQDESETTKQRLRQIKKLYSKQLVKVTDLLEVEARLDKIDVDVIEAENNLEITQESIAELTGTNIVEISTLNNTVEFNKLPDIADHWIKEARNNNPGLKAKQEAINAAREDLSQQLAGHYPVVNFQASALNSDIGFDNARTNHTQTHVAGLNLTLPIFDGGSTSARVYEARKRLELVMHEYESHYRTILKDTKASFLSTNTSVKRIQASKKAVESASKSYEAMDRGYKHGVVTIIDVLDAQHEKFRAKRDLQKAKYEYITNHIQLLRVTGLINDRALQEVNNWLGSPAEIDIALRGRAKLNFLEEID